MSMNFSWDGRAVENSPDPNDLVPNVAPPTEGSVAREAYDRMIHQARQRREAEAFVRQQASDPTRMPIIEEGTSPEAARRILTAHAAMGRLGRHGQREVGPSPEDVRRRQDAIDAARAMQEAGDLGAAEARSILGLPMSQDQGDLTVPNSQISDLAETTSEIRSAGLAPEAVLEGLATALGLSEDQLLDRIRNAIGETPADEDWTDPDPSEQAITIEFFHMQPVTSTFDASSMRGPEYGAVIEVDNAEEHQGIPPQLIIKATNPPGLMSEVHRLLNGQYRKLRFANFVLYIDGGLFAWEHVASRTRFNQAMAMGKSAYQNADLFSDMIEENDAVAAQPQPGSDIGDDDYIAIS